MFSNPALLKKLTLSGPISKENLQLIVSQCHHITTLSLSGDFLKSGVDVFSEINLVAFLHPIQHLTLSQLDMDNLDDGYINLCHILTQVMPNVISLTIRGSGFLRCHEDIFLSFADNCKSLTSLDITLKSSPETEFHDTWDGPMTLRRFPNSPQLTTVRVDFENIDLCNLWAYFLLSQKQLKHMTFISPSGYSLLFGIAGPIFYDNKTTLESIAIDVIPGCLINAGTFENMLNLHTLRLRGVSHDVLACVRGLRDLPKKIKVLELRNMYIRY
jgi:hypothetical protein